MPQLSSEMLLSLTPEVAEDFFNSLQDCRSVKAPTLYVAGYEFSNGRQLVLDRKNKATTLFLTPGSWLDQISDRLARVRHYAADDPRNSNIKANAPKLAQGYPMVQVQVATIEALTCLCNVYSNSESESYR